MDYRCPIDDTSKIIKHIRRDIKNWGICKDILFIEQIFKKHESSIAYISYIGFHIFSLQLTDPEK